MQGTPATQHAHTMLHELLWGSHLRFRGSLRFWKSTDGCVLRSLRATKRSQRSSCSYKNDLHHPRELAVKCLGSTCCARPVAPTCFLSIFWALKKLRTCECPGFGLQEALRLKDRVCGVWRCARGFATFPLLLVRACCPEPKGQGAHRRRSLHAAPILLSSSNVLLILQAHRNKPFLECCNSGLFASNVRERIGGRIARWLSASRSNFRNP